MLNFEQFFSNVDNNTYEQLKSHLFLATNKSFVFNKSLSNIKQHIELRTIFLER